MFWFWTFLLIVDTCPVYCRLDYQPMPSRYCVCKYAYAITKNTNNQCWKKYSDILLVKKHTLQLSGENSHLWPPGSMDRLMDSLGHILRRPWPRLQNPEAVLSSTAGVQKTIFPSGSIKYVVNKYYINRLYHLLPS